MNNNKKMLFLAVALVTVLILVSAVNATNTTDKSIDNTISEKTSTQASPVVKEETTIKEKTETRKNKEIIKTNKTKENSKTATQTINVNNYNELITAINTAVDDTVNNEYVINLNEGTYTLSENKVFNGNNNSNIIINGNNQKLSTASNRYLTFESMNISLNNLILSHRVTSYATLTLNNITHDQRYILSNGNTIVKDSTIQMLTIRSGNATIINSTINILSNDGSLILDEESSVNSYSGSGDIYTNNTDFIEKMKEQGIWIGNNIIENTTITTNINNCGKLTIINCTILGSIVNGEVTILNSTINSYIGAGTLIIGDDVFLGENADIKGSTEIISNNTSELLKKGIVCGNTTLKNLTLGNLNTWGNASFENCTINSILNKGMIELKNCIINDTDSPYWLTNYKIVFISNTTIPNTRNIYAMTGSSVIYSERPDYLNPTQFNGENIIENKTFVLESTNYGNLTLINCNITNKINNLNTITLINCSLSNNKMNIPIAGNVGNYGFLLNNNGYGSLIDCNVENNTFNFTSYSNADNRLNGAIYNQETLNITNTSFKNNTIGFLNSSTTRQIGTGSCIVNNATLYIDNCVFVDNWAAKEGGAIFTNSISAKTTIHDTIFNNNFAGINAGAAYISGEYLITNCNFTNNNIDNEIDGSSVADGISPSGGALYIDYANGTIDNCEFKNNNVGTKYGKISYNTFSGGAIRLSVGTHNIKHSIFTNNTAERGATLYIARLNWYDTNPITTTIDNCTFEDNFVERINGNMTSIIARNDGALNILNSVFENNKDATNIIYYTYDLPTQIINNKFINNTMSQNTICSDNTTTNSVINNNQYTNTSIADTLTLNLPNKIYTGEPITITGTYYILNSTFFNPETGTYESLNTTSYDSDILEQNKFQVYINGELKQIVDSLEFTITPTSDTMMVTVQPTISQTRKTLAIRATTLTDLVITPENYNEYISEGALVGVSKDSKILFQGTFTDKGKVFIDTSDIVIDGSNATFTNTMFILEASGITLQNMKINNTQTEYPIQNTKDNNIITRNTITLTNTDGKTSAIYNKASNTEITYNTLYVDGPATSIDHTQEPAISETQAILLTGGDKNIVEYNTITVTTTGTSAQFGTIEAITNHQQATNTQIRYNNITLNGNAKFMYAIDTLRNVQNTTITDNNIQVTGERYTAGIQATDGAENILIQRNTIKCICQNTTPVDEEAIAYGIVLMTAKEGYKTTNNITIQENNIDLTGTVNYGIEVYKATNTLIENNTINANGPRSMAIGYAHSQNSTIKGNTLKTSGDSSIPLRTVTEELQPLNVGILTQQDSDNILIEDNTIQTYDKQGQDTCIKIESSNVTIKNNNLTSSNKVGDNTITTTQPDTTTIEDNNAIEQNSTTETTTEDLTIGESTTLTAQFYDDTYTPVSDGKAIFRVNGKTLRDNQGNVIYADVINGRAELPDVNITQEWTKEDTTIQAIYIGDNNNEPITTTPTTVTVTKPEATITLDTPSTATAGTTITLKATVTDGENNITSGRVAFKLNGKTLKNAEGKALYANVENGIATITYTIPEKTKAKEYVLTAVFTDTVYDRVEAESKLNVVKA